MKRGKILLLSDSNKLSSIGDGNGSERNRSTIPSPYFPLDRTVSGRSERERQTGWDRRRRLIPILAGNNGCHRQPPPLG